LKSQSNKCKNSPDFSGLFMLGGCLKSFSLIYTFFVSFLLQIFLQDGLFKPKRIQKIQRLVKKWLI